VVADLLFELHGQTSTILIVVTHSAELAARFPDRRRLVGHRLQPAG
jgi:predicted ABC-type transport system involved in lysophospholipase L1 biosynthesis ATPase subunit